MSIITSYFANIKNLPNKYILISIARYLPKWLINNSDIYTYPILAPSEQLLRDYKNRLIDIPVYIERYQTEVLDKLDPIQVVTDFKQFGDDIALLCYETPVQFCHRFLISKWLNTKIKGLYVREYGYDPDTLL